MRNNVLAAAKLASQPLDVPDLDEMYDAVATPTDRLNYWRFLYHLAKLASGGTMLEIGSHEGTACLHWLRGGGSCAVAVDKWDRWRRERFTGLTMRTVQTDSVSLDAVAMVGSAQFDVVFIDSSHTYERTKDEYVTWRPLVKSGGVLLFDDVCYPDYGCTRFWSELQGDKMTLKHLHPEEFGFGVLFI